MTSLAEALPARMKEIREVIIPAYQSVGPAGLIAVAMMQNDLTTAEKALASGDVVAMIQSYQGLCAWKL